MQKKSEKNLNVGEKDVTQRQKRTTKKYKFEQKKNNNSNLY